MFMGAMRFIIIGALLICCLAAIFTNTSVDSDEYNDADPPTAFDIRMIGRAFPIISFALLYHVSIPNVA